MPYRTVVRTGLLSLLLLGLGASITCADFQFFVGNPSGFQSTLNSLGMSNSNVLFNRSGLNLSGFTVNGYVNNTNFQRVDVSSGEMLMASGGQAQSVRAEDGGFSNATISSHPGNESANQAFGSLAFNIVNRGPDGSVTVNVLNGGNVVDSITFELGPGNDFFGVIGLDDSIFTGVDITSTDDLAAIRQIRVGFGGGCGDDDDDDDDDDDGGGGGGGGGTVVPEPGSVFGWLVVSAILGTVVCLNRRSRK